MTPKDIVVFIEEEAGRAGRLAFAAALAKKWGAHLIATFVADRLDLQPFNSFAIGAGLEHLLQSYRDSNQEAEAQARKIFERLVVDCQIAGEWRYSENEVGEPLMLHARHASLAIVGPPSVRTGATTTLSLSEDVIFASGRPSLLLPTDWPADRIGRRIVVGWNGSREAARAIADAMPFLIAAEQVQVIVVAEDKASGLLGADPGADITRHLARHNVPVALEQCREGDAGAILLDRARRLDADLLVMGAYGQSRISEFVFGGATRTVLGAASVPILLSR
ncbi:MAG TPA: universal stress protein [Dongiaceae bacterium]|nr:universal stress protein [Dongiaceae bacterium]